MTAFVYSGSDAGPLMRYTRKAEHTRIVWRLEESIAYAVLYRGNALTFDLKPGDETDGVSAPEWLLWLVPAVTPATFLPAALHDHLWDERQAELKAGRTPTYPRAEIDWIFRQALRGEGAPAIAAWAMWAAVRLQAWLTHDH